MARLSLIVSTLGRTTQLERLLASLVTQDYRNFETIIVDQNADDRLAPILDAYREKLKVVATRSERGISCGRNAGLAIARGAIVAFPDDDCWYPPGVLARVSAAFESAPSLDLLSGRTVDAAFVESLGVYLKRAEPICRANIWRIGNSNTIFARARVGLRFDESLGVGSRTQFQSGEETDFLLRLLETGASMQFDPTLLIHHDQVDLRCGQDGVRRARQYAPGQGRVLRLHRYGPHGAFWVVFRPMARAVIAAISGDMPLARYKFAWSQGVAAGYLARTAAHKDGI
jgi:glycosyltransferase involved in cell wall biosynthesis